MVDTDKTDMAGFMLFLVITYHYMQAAADGENSDYSDGDLFTKLLNKLTI